MTAPMAAFPTPVGMNRPGNGPGRSNDSVPHARGDEPVTPYGDAYVVGRSPRPWG